MDKKTKKFLYKTAYFNKPLQNETLQTLLVAALKIHPKPMRRRHTPVSDEATFHLINYNQNHGKKGPGGNLFGAEFFTYTQGSDQSTLEINEEADELEVDQIFPPDKNKEFLDGTLYFGVLENHVIILQSAKLRSLALERHLNWLLIEKTKVLDNENYVALIDHIPLNKKKFKGVRGLEITTPVSFKPVGSSTQTTNVTIEPTGRAWASMQSLIGEVFDLPTHMNLKEITEAPMFQLKLSLTWQRKRSEDDNDFINNIAYEMRHVGEEFDYVIDTSSGKITKDQFKLEKKYSIEWKKGRPAFNDIFAKMLEWLEDLVNNGNLK